MQASPSPPWEHKRGRGRWKTFSWEYGVESRVSCSTLERLCAVSEEREANPTAVRVRLE
jgi:hypothetical protein